MECGESPEEELLDLFTSHRSDACSSACVFLTCFMFFCCCSIVLFEWYLSLVGRPNISKDAVYPFPWTSNAGKSSGDGAIGQEPCGIKPSGSETRPQSSREAMVPKVINDYMEKFPQFSSLFAECQALECISFRLFRPNATAGSVLLHVSSTVESLFAKEEPLIFKFGYTSNPVLRWQHPRYGYQSSKDKWSALLVLHLTSEPYTHAMLEATLIDKYGGN